MDFKKIEKIVDARLKKAVKDDCSDDIERWIKLQCKISAIISRYYPCQYEPPKIVFIEGVNDSKI